MQNGHTGKLWLRLNGYDYTITPSADERNKIFKLESLAIRRKRNDFLIFKMMTGKVALSLSELSTILPQGVALLKFIILCPKVVFALLFLLNKRVPSSCYFLKKYALPSSLNQYKRLVDIYLKNR